MFESVLVANRGEIARRVIRTVRALGIKAIAVYSEADADLPYVAEADEAVLIGPAQPAKSYLDVDAVMEAARRTNARAASTPIAPIRSRSSGDTAGDGVSSTIFW